MLPLPGLAPWESFISNILTAGFAANSDTFAESRVSSACCFAFEKNEETPGEKWLPVIEA